MTSTSLYNLSQCFLSFAQFWGVSGVIAASRGIDRSLWHSRRGIVGRRMLASISVAAIKQSCWSRALLTMCTLSHFVTVILINYTKSKSLNGIYYFVYLLSNMFRSSHVDHHQWLFSLDVVLIQFKLLGITHKNNYIWYNYINNFFFISVNLLLSYFIIVMTYCNIKTTKNY